MKFEMYMLVPLAGVAIALPSLSQATSEWHQVNGEVGYIHHPDQARSIKSRQEVVAEMAAARKDGTMWLALRGVPIVVKSTAPGKTRQQVLNEIQSETVSDRHARMIQ